MKYLSLLLLTFTLLACTDDDAPVGCPDGLTVGDSFQLPFGQKMTLIEVEDALCCCDCVCIWGGYLGVTLLSESGDTVRIPDPVPGNLTDPVTNQITYDGTVISIEEVNFRGEELNCGRQGAEGDYCVSFGLSPE